MCSLLFVSGCSDIKNDIDFNSDSFIKLDTAEDCLELNLSNQDTYHSEIKVESDNNIADNDVNCTSENKDVATIHLSFVHNNVIYYEIKGNSIGETYVYLTCRDKTTSKLKVIVTESIETTSETTSNSENTTLKNKPKEEALLFNKFLKGRGESEEGSGRSEPYYVGEYGYVVPSNSYLEDNITSIENTPWYIPTYSKIDADHYETTGEYIEHKTVVKVLEQNLTHTGYGHYSGYLKIEVVKTGKISLINVGNFVTNNYWDYSILDSLHYGKCLVKYHQVSEFLPVERNNEIVNLKDGQLLLTHTTPLIGGLDSSKRQVSCYILKGADSTTEYSNEIFLNSDDIEIVY